MLRIALGGLLVAGLGRAEGGAVAAAEAQFQRALTELKEGHLDVACPAFAESYRLDPRPGTLFAQAECETKQGKPATASTHFAQYVDVASKLPGPSRANHKERIALAEQRRKELAPTIAWLTLVLPGGAPKATEVRLDHTILGAPSLGVALPLDPGPHVASTRVPGGAEREDFFSLDPGEKKRRELATDVPDATPSVAVVEVPPSKAKPVAREPETSEPEEERSDAKEKPAPGPERDSTALYVAGGIGVAGLIVGAAAGAAVLQKKSVVDVHCRDIHCDSTGKQAAEDAKPYALVSTIGFGLGAAGIATAVVLALSGPGPAATSRRKSLTWGASLQGGARALVLDGAF
jgi:hypothetical protein